MREAHSTPKVRKGDAQSSVEKGFRGVAIWANDYFHRSSRNRDFIAISAGERPFDSRAKMNL